MEENETLNEGVKYKLINADSVEALKTLPENSVDCCITSPPYYALRDYGTGHWEGGDPNCPHYRANKVGDSTTTGHKAMFGNNNAVGDSIYKSVCPLCGAIRVDKQIGLEETPEQYIQKLVNVFHEVKRVLKEEGTLWVNIGDSYWGSGSRGFDFTDVLTEASEIQKGNKGTINLTNLPELKGNVGDYKNKDLIGIPWMLAFALRADGWYLRQDIVWHKLNSMPESVKDRCTKSHEYIFLLSKKPHYYFDNKAIQEEAVYAGDDRGARTDSRRGTYMNSMSGKTGEYRNKRDVWQVPVSVGYKDDDGAHYATYSEKLIEPCVLAGTKTNGIVLDPFSGTGTTGATALRLGRRYIGVDLNSKYISMSDLRLQRIADQNTLFDLMGD